jgi:F-type H+-transporting ATPase subunit b
MKNLLMVLIFLVGITASSAINLAQEEHAVAATEAAEHAAEEHAESPWAVVFRWINFFILFGGLGFLLKQPIAHFFEARKQEIRSGLESAQRADVEARARMSDIEKRLGRLSADVADLRHQAEQESASDRERILAEARRDVERVMDQSKQEIERVARSVEREAREHIADLVIDRSGKALRTEMTQDDQKRVVVRFINDL